MHYQTQLVCAINRSYRLLHESTCSAGYRRGKRRGWTTRRQARPGTWPSEGCVARHLGCDDSDIGFLGDGLGAYLITDSLDLHTELVRTCVYFIRSVQAIVCANSRQDGENGPLSTQHQEKTHSDWYTDSNTLPWYLLCFHHVALVQTANLSCRTPSNLVGCASYAYPTLTTLDRDT